MSATWDAQQREWLRAMGYAVLRDAGGESVAPDPEPAQARAAESPPRPAAANGAATSRPAPAPGRAAERVDAARIDYAERAGQLARALPDRLMRALLRAAGRRENEMPDDAFLAVVDTRALRGDPAAKRALWPALRAMRAARRR